MITDTTTQYVMTDELRYSSSYNRCVSSGGTKAELEYNQVINYCIECGHKTETGYEYCKSCLSKQSTPHPDFVAL